MNSITRANFAESTQLTITPAAQTEKPETVSKFLDRNFPLDGASHNDVAQYRVFFRGLVAHLKTGMCVGLSQPGQFSEYGGDTECPSLIVLDNGEQHIELQL